jgi:hypothetical protein
VIDLEQTLRDSLHAYIDAVDPGPPPATIALSDTPVSRRPLALLAAGVLLIAGVGGLWWTSADRRPDPAPSDGSVAPVEASVGTWTIPSESPLSARQFPTVAWTGTEFIVWGGVVGNTGLTDGALYDPATDTWRPMADRADVRAGGAAVWIESGLAVATRRSAAIYDPGSGTWTLLPEIPMPAQLSITDLAWTGTELLAIAVDPDASGRSVTLRVWRTDLTDWVEEDSIVVREGLPRARFSTTSDQLSVHDPVPVASPSMQPPATSDGFALWDGDRNGWQFTIGRGWTRLPELMLYDAAGALVSDSRLVAVDGELLVLATGKTADADDLRFARLNGGTWSDWTVIDDTAPAGWEAVAAGQRVVVLNGFDEGRPVLIDPAASAATRMMGYPIDTVIDRGAAWSGSQLFVFGGQRSTGGGETSTESTRTVSSAAALWTSPTDTSPVVLQASSTSEGAALGPPNDMTLTLVNGCLGATLAEEGGSGDVAIWPQGTIWDDDRRQVVFADGRAVAIGDTVSVRSVSGYYGSEALGLADSPAEVERCVDAGREVLYIDL